MNKNHLIPILALALPLVASCGASTESESIRVMSFNIRQGNASDGENSWDNRKTATPAMLADQAPAVFGIQEAQDFQISYIKDNCPGYDCVGVGRQDGASEGEHMSVFYDINVIELLDWGTYWLSETPDVPSIGWDARCIRTATWTLLKVKETGRMFYFVNTHLDHIGVEARKNGLALILNRIASMNPDGYPMILTGDLNVTPDDSCLDELDKIMQSARVAAEDSDETPSFNGWEAPMSVIDYIYFSGFSKCTDFKVVNKTYLDIPFVSDHYPVVATLEF